MRLTHISIENFRGITSLALRLGQLTVVIGENNHGKTSLLDVLDRCLGETADGEDSGWEYRDFRRDAAGVASPIRVVLAFERPGDATAPALTDRLFDTAMSVGADGVFRLRVAFLGKPGSGAMEVRLLDGRGETLEVPSQAAIVQRLRQLHPVLVVRLAQPPEDVEFEWVSRSRERDFDIDDDDDPEEAIARVYHRLTRTRGTIPTAEVHRGLQAARALRVRMAGESRGRPGPVERILDGFARDPGAGSSHTTGGGSHNLGLLMVLGSLLEARGGTRMGEEVSPIIAIEEPEVHLHPMLLSSAWDVIQDLRAQTLVTTNSGELLSEIPLHHLRRLARRNGRIESFQLGEGTLSADALRRVAYHIRAKRGGTLFARCWVLVEGETEYWLIRELGTVLGYDLEAEGVRCVEFAQCGVSPLLRLANDLGIRWHLLSDGDDSGVAFANDAARQMRGGDREEHVTRLERRNMEMLLFSQGFQDVYYRAAGLEPPGSHGADAARMAPRKVVSRAIRAHSKPFLALMVAEEAARRGPSSVPGQLRHVIETSVRLARASIEES